MRLMIRAAITAVALTLACPASAAALCLPVGALYAALSTNYGEAITGAGTAGDDAVMLFSNPETGTVTIAIVRPDGVACVIAAGEDWEAREYVAPPAPAPGSRS